MIGEHHELKISNRKAASGEWPSRLVLGQLRFSPEDVAAIEELLIHPATRHRREAHPLPPAKKRPSGFADLTDRPIRMRRGAAPYGQRW
ncbi:hypothetical protein HS048_34315 [Planomonospora sp. ID91781]|uniref:hypothetical protein n=1 Tax=Planomonospora sp. ID91781 TaxID=2738135 RepID=UPI0018C447AB|nr:hypothetical protein [Planomonospora sp. ID91781]MBG0825761.1 hypothetical protein [Planomonospora sp. ID91781]